MHPKSHQNWAAQSIFLSSIEGLANTLAVVITFFATAPIYGRTVDWVIVFTTRHYGAEFADVIGLAWFGIVGFVVFFTARASVSTGLVVGGAVLAVRFL